MLDMWHRYSSHTMYLKATPTSKFSCCTIWTFPSISSWTADISSKLMFMQGLASHSPLKMNSEPTNLSALCVMMERPRAYQHPRATAMLRTFLLLRIECQRFCLSQACLYTISCVDIHALSAPKSCTSDERLQDTCSTPFHRKQ